MKVYKRGQSWWFAGTVNGQHIRRSLGSDIKTQVEAEQWLADFIGRESELALRNFITAYLHESRVRLSEGSWARYKTSLRHFESHFGLTRKIITPATKLPCWS